MIGCKKRTVLDEKERNEGKSLSPRIHQPSQIDLFADTAAILINLGRQIKGSTRDTFSLTCRCSPPGERPCSFPDPVCDWRTKQWMIQLKQRT